ncbi:PKD domain-containing protein [Candidatus Kuenenbacteria bacterium]|nr:PKD domain-containing protein [Candidatus Kuenenbacteria bacterium]
MKMKATIIFCVSIMLFSPLTALFAQEEVVIEPVVRAVAGEDRNLVVGSQAVFSAIGSVVDNVSDESYVWNFGDGNSSTGKNVTYIYRNSGVYRVNLTITAQSEGQALEATDEIIVNVDKDVAILITDKNVDLEKFKMVQSISSSQGILLVNIQETEANVDYAIEKELAQKILKNKDNIRQAGSIIIWTEKNIGLNALLEAAQNLTKSSEENGSSLDTFGFGSKYFVVITDQNFSATGKVAQSLYNLLTPQFIVLTRKEASTDIFTSTAFSPLLEKLKNSFVDYRLIGLHTQRDASQLRPWNFVSYLVNYMVDKGLPLNTIYLILILPVIATIMAFARQVIGIKALGIYTPSIVAVAFLVTGLKYGLLIFIITLLVGTISRLGARKIRLSYLPRMAIVLSLVSFSIFGIFLVGAWSGKVGLLEISIFPILVMVLLTEKFISAQIERGNKNAVVLILETLFLSIICYWLASWQVLRTLIIGYPEYVLLTLIINILIGKWTGLRLIEYYRFRKVIKNVELAEKK